jgi:hypothetical protein
MLDGPIRGRNVLRALFFIPNIMSLLVVGYVWRFVYTSALPEIAGDAALYFDPLKPEDIGQQLAHVYKDEHARSLMIERGLLRAGSFSWSQSCKQVREILMEAAASG